MTSRTRLIAALLGGTAVVVAGAVWLLMATSSGNETSWPPAARAEFIRSCVEKCRLAPGVTEDRYPLCDATCICSADEGEKIMTSAELSAAGMAMASGRLSPAQTAKIDRLKAASQSCAAQKAPDKK